jgi:hypothetical protein
MTDHSTAPAAPGQTLSDREIAPSCGYAIYSIGEHDHLLKSTIARNELICHALIRNSCLNLDVATSEDFE